MNGELIFREALKEEICNDKELSHWLNDSLMLKVFKYIDNAPTASDRYDEGYAQGYIDGSTGADWKGGAE